MLSFSFIQPVTTSEVTGYLHHFVWSVSGVRIRWASCWFHNHVFWCDFIRQSGNGAQRKGQLGTAERNEGQRAPETCQHELDAFCMQEHDALSLVYWANMLREINWGIDSNMTIAVICKLSLSCPLPTRCYPVFPLVRLTPCVNEIILDHQCGFRCNNSTTEQILYIRLLQKHENVKNQ